MPRLACLLISILIFLIACTSSARADSIVLIPGASLTAVYAGSSGDFGAGYTPRSASASAVTVFKLSSDGLSLDVGFRNSTSGGATTWLDEFNFFTNVNVSQPGQFLSMPVRAVWQTSSSTGGPFGQNLGVGTRLGLFQGNGLLPGEEGLVRFYFDSPVTSLSLMLVFVRFHFITTDGEGATFAYGIEARPTSVVYTPPNTPIPEPGVLEMVFAGLGLFGVIRRSRSTLGR